MRINNVVHNKKKIKCGQKNLCFDYVSRDKTTPKKFKKILCDKRDGFLYSSISQQLNASEKSSVLKP